ncbi:MAG: rhodanese-like domain-containing protein [Micrococcaceae bacterium]
MDVKDIKSTDVICDVREDDEFEAGHIKGAYHIPLSQLMTRYDELPLDEPIYVICRTGGRSAQATNWLNQHGVEAYNVDGGMGAWMDENLPMVSDNGQEPYVI